MRPKTAEAATAAIEKRTRSSLIIRMTASPA
jgi:hypothetical protein